MTVLLLLGVLLGVNLQDVLRKNLSTHYGEQRSVQYTYNLALVLGALTVHGFIYGSQWSGHLPSLPYALLYSLGFTGAVYGAMAAMACGPLSLTVLLSSFGLLIPTLYGLIALNEQLSLAGIAGLILLAVSLVLINWRRKGEKPFQKKWFFFAIAAFLGNGVCSLAQKMHQTRWPGQWCGDFMLEGMGVMVLIALAFFLVSAGKNRSVSLRGSGYGLPAGFLNAGVNAGMLYLSSRLPATFLYPIISAGGIVLAWVTARFFFHEKLSSIRQIGFLLGGVAIVLMNLR